MKSKKQVLRQLEKMAKEGEKHVKKEGISEDDIVDIVHRFRKANKS